MTISTIGTNGLNQAADTILCGTSGNVGIGTSSPINLGAGRVGLSLNGSTDSVLWMLANGAASGYLQATESIINLVGANNIPVAIMAQGTGYILFVTGSSERARIDTSGQMWTQNGAGSVAKAYDCRAWVNFNGTGTVAIRASGNVSSITDNGTGDYTVNFTTAMPDTSFGWSGGCSNTAVGSASFVVTEYSSGSKTTSSLRVYTGYGNTLTDSPNVHVSIFR